MLSDPVNGAGKRAPNTALKPGSQGVGMSLAKK